MYDQTSGHRIVKSTAVQNPMVATNVRAFDPEAQNVAANNRAAERRRRIEADRAKWRERESEREPGDTRRLEKRRKNHWYVGHHAIIRGCGHCCGLFPNILGSWIDKYTYCFYGHKSSINM